jgi:hypothetical protein
MDQGEEPEQPGCAADRGRDALKDTQRNRMANGRCATREEAMAAFRRAFDRVPDKTIDKSA